MEYRKPDGNGNVELQWNLIGNATESLADAVAAAAAADLTVLAVGGSDQTTNEGCDRAELDLTGRQLELVPTPFNIREHTQSRISAIVSKIQQACLPMLHGAGTTGACCCKEACCCPYWWALLETLLYTQYRMLDRITMCATHIVSPVRVPS